MNTSKTHGLSMLGGLPNIVGHFGMVGLVNYWTPGDNNPFYKDTSLYEDNGSFTSYNKRSWISFNAHRVNSIYDSDETRVVPSNLFMYYVVKY